MIESNWKISGTGKEFEIVIPPNSEAMVELPVAKGEVVTESGKPLAEAGGVTLVEAPVHRMKVGSGRYRFQIQAGK
jgi:alpha-L-rhamnosidase